MKPSAQIHEDIASERTPAHGCTAKTQWVRHHANNMFRLWLSWRTPLGVARDYLKHLRQDLSAFYDDPLKRALIEASYGGTTE